MGADDSALPAGLALPGLAGHYHPANGTTEIGGIGTHPAARRQGLGAAVTVALAVHARDPGVKTVALPVSAEGGP